MGHKVHPKCFRLGETTTWDSKWFSKRGNYQKFLKQDVLIRKFLFGKLKKSGLAQLDIERSPDSLKVIAYVAKPGVVIGRQGQGAEEMKQEIQKEFLKNEKKTKLELSIQEVKNPGLSARIIAQNMTADIEKRLPYRRIMKRIIDQAKKSGAKGVKVIAGGRLDGAEIARQETLTWGKVPLHTLRADIDYARETANTTYGCVGVKIWIYKGEKFKE